MSKEPIKIRARELDQEKHPDLQRVRSLVLREGPRSKTELVYTVIQDRHEKEYHHDAISIKSYTKLKGEWQLEPTKSISLDSDKTDELQTLTDFIRANREGSLPQKSAEFLVVDAPSGIDLDALQKLLKDLQDEQKIDVLLQIVDSAASNPATFDILLDRANSNPKLFAEAAAALNLATYVNALQRLRTLIESADRVPEQDFQTLLKENPWMFGSEYSELLPNRRLTRDELQDFVLRRTTDNYIELIEIKTPLLGRDLFLHDDSHDSWYASSELSKVLGQVQHYLEQIDSERYTISARDNEDPLKIRAKIIIGRDGSEEQRRALRRLNGHLHRIEVLTFDQLLKIAQRVLDYLESAIRPSESII
jgi:hypothetical protein